MDLLIQFLFIAISVGWIQCHKAYLDQFPTAVISRIKAVKDPYCELIKVSPAHDWLRVGHNAINASHGASSSLGEYKKNSRNAFGEMFDDQKANHAGPSWTFQFTTTECMADPDKDGKTNGEELGINCNTMEILPGSTDAGVTHPGICEPTCLSDCIKQNKDIKSYCKESYVQGLVGWLGVMQQH